MPNTLSVLFKQQLRWRRSIVRDFFFTLRTLPQHVWKLHPNTVLTLVLTPLGALVGFLVVVTMLTSDPLAWAGPVPLITALGIGAVLTWVIKKYSAQRGGRSSAGLWRLRSAGRWSAACSSRPWLCARWIPQTGARERKQQEVPLGNANR